MKEIWIPIKNSLHYSVSNLGRVRRDSHQKLHNINKTVFHSPEKVLALTNRNSKKYWRIKIFRPEGKHTTEAVHRLVAQAFIPNPHNYPQVNHIDGNRDNNSVPNLEWCTQAENMQHRIKVLGQKTWKEGEELSWTKLTEVQVRQIHQLLETTTRENLAVMFNISQSTIKEIIRGGAWKQLNLDFSKFKGRQHNKTLKTK